MATSATTSATNSAPGELTRIKGVLQSASSTVEFRSRLDGIDPSLDDYSYAAETYDAVIILALAAEAAATDQSTAVASEIIEVTRGGQQCSTFSDCRDLVDDGEDIDYVRIGGTYALDDAGDPTVASFAVLEYGTDSYNRRRPHRVPCRATRLTSSCRVSPDQPLQQARTLVNAGARRSVPRMTAPGCPLG